MKPSYGVRLALSVVAVALAGCSGGPSDLPIERLNAFETAFNIGKVEGCVALYTDDAEILAEDSPAAHGSAAIGQFFTNQIEREIQFDAEPALSLTSGDLALDQGTYLVRNVRLGREVERGDYLHIWRRVQGDEWRIFRTILNITSAQSAAVSVNPSEDQSADVSDDK